MPVRPCVRPRRVDEHDRPSRKFRSGPGVDRVLLRDDVAAFVLGNLSSNAMALSDQVNRGKRFPDHCLSFIKQSPEMG